MSEVANSPTRPLANFCMGLFPQTFIDDLRMQANILTVVQEYVPLKRAGTSYKGNCPFHNERPRRST